MCEVGRHSRGVFLNACIRRRHPHIRGGGDKAVAFPTLAYPQGRRPLFLNPTFSVPGGLRQGDLRRPSALRMTAFLR